jgi:hypothetical protein
MWLTHPEFDATNPFMRHWFDAMGEQGRYVCYDARGVWPLRVCSGGYQLRSLGG